MSEAGEAKTRSHPRERGEAKDRRSRPRVRVAADTVTHNRALNCEEAADASRLPGGRHAERGMSRERKEAEG